MRIATAADELTGIASELCEILDARLDAEPSGEADDRADVQHLREIEEQH